MGRQLEPGFVALIADMEELHGSDDHRTLTIKSSLGSLLGDMQRFDENVQFPPITPKHQPVGLENDVALDCARLRVVWN